MNDLKDLPYAELIALSTSVADEIATRGKEKVTVKWFTQQGASFAPRIESLKKQYDKIIIIADKIKGVTLKVKMDINVKLLMKLEEMLGAKFYVDKHDIFGVECSGELLNPKDCGVMSGEVQDHINSLMDNICDEVLGIYPNLEDEINDFIENLQSIREDLENEPVDLSVALKSFLKVKK